MGFSSDFTEIGQQILARLSGLGFCSTHFKINELINYNFHCPGVQYNRQISHRYRQCEQNGINIKLNSNGHQGAPIRMPQKQISYRTFSSQFKLIRKEKNAHLGEHMLMKNTTTKRRAIVKNHECSSIVELNTILGDYEGLAKMYDQTDFLCNFIGYCEEESKGLHSINLIYDFHQNTLEEQVSSMLLKNQKFSEKQLDCFIDCSLGGLAALEKYGMNHLCLKFSNFVVQNRNTIGLVYRIFYTPYLSSSVAEVKENRTNIDEYNFSQKQLDLLNSNGLQSQASFSFGEKLKSDRQSLGLMVLRMATLEIKHGIYMVTQQNQLLWDLKQLKNRMDLLYRLYSKDLARKVQYLLLEKSETGFQDLPAFIATPCGSFSIGSHSRVRGSAQRSFSRSKSPVSHSSNKKYLEVSSSKMSNAQRQSRVIKTAEPFNVSSIGRLKSQSLQNSKQSLRSLSPSPFESESPSKKKSHKYEQLKLEIQNYIYPRINVQDSKGKIKDNNGSDYLGGIKDNKKNGNGICYFKEGDIYAGEWKNDRIEGTGTYLFNTCDLYRGEIKNGAKHGRGKYQFSNGNYYEGEWKWDKRNGYGVYFQLGKQQKYEGTWSSGVKEGQGIYRWKNGDVYQGGFTAGMKSGSGVATKGNGTKITGQWYNDNLRGIASIKYRTGLTFTGEVRLEGKNSLVLSGHGQEVSVEGTTYEGQYMNNSREGNCKVEFRNGDTYQGSMINNKFQSLGTYYYSALNCRYSGEWKAGLQSGKGKLTFANGTTIETNWEKGRPGQTGKIVYSNGDVYEGQIDRMGRNGRGVYYRQNGQTIEGVFQNGVLVDKSRPSASSLIN